MKKYKIRDEDGNVMTVEEEEVKEKDACAEQIDDDEMSLTSDEITALKSLAGVADKLMALLNKDVTDDDKEIEKKTQIVKKKSDDDDEEEIEKEDEDEEIVDTDEDVEEAIVKKTTDSRRSIGAIERHQKATDSEFDKEDEIAQAWAKRYGG